jgi:C4-dicarboxylate transporter DctM subunit
MSPVAVVSILLGFLASRMGIFVALGTISLILFWIDGTPFIGGAQVVLDRLNSDALIAVPFFVIAATFMQSGGIAKALIDAANAWVGRLQGGLALVCVVATTVFAAISGSSVATALAMGTILIPAMVEQKYERKFALGVVGGSGTLGILIPPSLALIVYAIVAEESVPRLFLAGVIPGLMQAVLFGAFIFWYARRNNYPKGDPISMNEFLRVNLRALPAMAIPLVIFVGIYGGIVTVSEAAALSAVIAIGAGIHVYRAVRYRDVFGQLAESFKVSGSIIVIVASALMFGHWITESGVPARLVEAVTALDLKAWQFLLFMNLLMLVLGMFLEVIAVILITLPLVLPLLVAFDISPIHYAIVVTVNMELALLTPPIGLNLYVLSSISKAPLAEVIRGVNPFILLLLGLLILVTYVPELSTWLPNAVFE